jgi:hypothetical protein
MRKRIPFTNRLDELGITAEELQFYRDSFVKGNNRYWRNDGDIFGWRQIKRKDDQYVPLDKYAIAKHLQEEYWVARRMPGKTDYFCIDIDFDNDDSLIERYNSIISIIPNPLVVSSSYSGGLHLYYFLDKDEWRNQISEVISEWLISNNITIQPRKFELFPGSIDHLRLPFGLGSTVLNPDSLQPLGLSLKECLAAVKNHPRKSLINFRNAMHINQIPIYFKSSYSNKEKRTTAEVQRLLENGIEELGTRNEAQMFLIQHYIGKLGYTADEAENAIMNWYNSFNHNSKDWSNSPMKVEKELKSAIWCFLKIHSPRITYDDISLSRSDINFILRKTKIPDCKYSANDFRTHCFIFDLLRFFRSHDNNKLYLPFNTIKTINGASHKTASEKIKFCIDKKLLTLIKRHDHRSHKSRLYRLNYQFDDDHGIKSFIDGLFWLMDESMIRKLYSRRTYIRIFSEYKMNQEKIKRSIEMEI